MTHDPKADRPMETVVSRRRVLASLGLLSLVGVAGPSLVAPDEAEAWGKKKKKVSRGPKKKNHGKKVSRVARKKGRSKKGRKY